MTSNLTNSTTTNIINNTNTHVDNPARTVTSPQFDSYHKVNAILDRLEIEYSTLTNRLHELDSSTNIELYHKLSSMSSDELYTTIQQIDGYSLKLGRYESELMNDGRVIDILGQINPIHQQYFNEDNDQEMT